MEKPDVDVAPRRRLRDQLMAHDTSQNPALSKQHALENQLLLVDDDLQQAATTIAEIESFLGAAHRLLERPDLGRRELSQLAERADAIDALDTLSESLQSLRRRLAVVAQSLE